MYGETFYGRQTAQHQHKIGEPKYKYGQQEQVMVRKYNRKPKLKNCLFVLRYRLPRFGGKGQNQRVATFWRHKSIEIDRLNYKLVSICGPFRSKNNTLCFTVTCSWCPYLHFGSAIMLVTFFSKF